MSHCDICIFTIIKNDFLQIVLFIEVVVILERYLFVDTKRLKFKELKRIHYIGGNMLGVDATLCGFAKRDKV